MARGPSKRVVMNRAALDELSLAVADGMGIVGEQIVSLATQFLEQQLKPPPETGKLQRSGAWGVWVHEKKVAGRADKPRRERLYRNGVVLMAGFGDPLAHLIEFGTAERETKAGHRTGHGPAMPFLSPAEATIEPRIQELMAPTVRARLGKRP